MECLGFVYKVSDEDRNIDKVAFGILDEKVIEHVSLGRLLLRRKGKVIETEFASVFADCSELENVEHVVVVQRTD